MTPEPSPQHPSTAPGPSEALFASPMNEQIRMQTEQQAEGDQRNNRFISVLGHELRNPIAAIAMAAEALSRLCADAPDKKAMTDVIYRQARHATRLLDDLLDIARIASGKIELRKERIDLVDRIRATVSTRQAECDSKRVQVHVELSPQPLWVDADAARLSQAIGNLVDSAIKATDPGGQLVVTAQLTHDRNQASLEVCYSGIGIEPEAMPTVFDPFGRDDVSRHGRGGLGLGLALAKGLIEWHDGSLMAESEGLDKGACFRVLLPLAGAPAGVPADPPAAKVSTADGLRPLRILIIDDSPDVVASLEFLLKLSGHEISVAADGTRGIEVARQLVPDVVLCDIGLPDIDGYAVARALRADTATATSYLIAVSGYGSEEDQRQSLDAGFDLHLNKPEGFVGLNERLQQLPIGRR